MSVQDPVPTTLPSTKPSQLLDECTTDVFKNGFALCRSTAEMLKLSVPLLDMLCNDLTRAATEAQLDVKFGWHFEGDYPMLLYLGAHQDAVDLCTENAALIQNYLPSTVQFQMTATSQPLSFYSANMWTMKQMTNHKRKMLAHIKWTLFSK